MVEAWLLPVNPGLGEDYCRSVLSQDEWERAARFRFPKDRALSINARAALRTLLGRRLGVPPGSIRFEYEERGRPILASPAPLSFSVSHSGDIVAIALSSTTVGIDIEADDRQVDFESLLGYIPEVEAAAVRKLPEEERRTAFLRSWTRKEARLKATGKGLAGIHDDEPAGWHYFDISRDGYLGAIATVLQNAEFRLHNRLDVCPRTLQDASG